MTERRNLGTADWVGANVHGAEGSYAATGLVLTGPDDGNRGKTGRFSVSFPAFETIGAVGTDSGAFHAKSQAIVAADPVVDQPVGQGANQEPAKAALGQVVEVAQFGQLAFRQA